MLSEPDENIPVSGIVNGGDVPRTDSERRRGKGVLYGRIRQYLFQDLESVPSLVFSPFAGLAG